MKRRILALLLAVLTLTALTAAALAADTTTGPLGAFNIKDSEGYTLTVVGGETAAGGFYANAARFELTCTGLKGQYSLVLLLKEDGTEETKGIPTEKNLQYIDQQNVAATTKFILFPKQMTAGTYNVYVSTDSASLTKVASLEYGTEPEYTLGDVDDDGQFTATDSLCALQMAVGIGTWTERQYSAARVTKGNDVTATDAMWILQRAVGLIGSFENIG